MKSAITQMVKFLERMESKEKCRLALQIRHMDCPEYPQTVLRVVRFALTEARRLELEEAAQRAKPKAKPKR